LAIALGGLYVVKGNKLDTIDTLVDWNDHTNRDSAREALDRVLKIIKTSSHTPGVLRTMVADTKSGKRFDTEYPPHYAAVGVPYAAGAKVGSIALERGVSSPAVSRMISRIATMCNMLDIDQRPEYSQALLDRYNNRQRSARRSS